MTLDLQQTMKYELIFYNMKVKYKDKIYEYDYRLYFRAYQKRKRREKTELIIQNKRKEL
jgi:hypothetical protein